jgi:hypothetical protein
VKRKAKPLDKPAAQLDGALALFGCNNNVASYDNVATRLRAGEVIGRAANDGESPEPRKPANKRNNNVSS